MAKSTHEGTCQVCGRLQALPNGVLAKHGYDVEFHFFRGVCPGAAHQPLELERAFADEVAASLDKQAKIHHKEAERVARGERLPTTAKSGKHVLDEKRKFWVDEVVPYAEAPEHHQRYAVEALEWSLRAQSKAESDAARSIRDRAYKITGKQKLVVRRVEQERKELTPGVKFRLHGAVCTVVRVETRTAWGCGPYLNGQAMPHVIYSVEGREKLGAYPTRLIRQAAIL